MLFEEAEQIGFSLRELIHLTLLRRLVGPPAEQFRAMAETIARHMIIANFDDEFRLEGVPDHSPFLGSIGLVPQERNP